MKTKVMDMSTKVVCKARDFLSWFSFMILIEISRVFLTKNIHKFANQKFELVTSCFPYLLLLAKYKVLYSSYLFVNRYYVKNFILFVFLLFEM